ncbi:unnamed protein product [Boreogadus saida]
MLRILRRFNWTWVGLLISDEDYGRHAARLFQSDLAQSGGGCLAYLEVLPWVNHVAELQRIVSIMKKSTSNVVIVFAHPSNMLNLMEEVKKFWEHIFRCKFVSAGMEVEGQSTMCTRQYMPWHMPYMTFCSVFQGVGLLKVKAVPVYRD